MKKFILLIYIALAAVTAMSLPSCKKETDTEGESAYVQPEGEIVLLAAMSANVRTNGYKETGTEVVVRLAENYVYNGKSYRDVSLESENIKALTKTNLSVQVTFRDDKTVKLYFQEEVALNLEDETVVNGFPEEEKRLGFSVTKAGHGDIVILITADGSFSPRVSYDEDKRTGELSFVMNAEEGVADVATITVTDGKNFAAYTLKAVTTKVVISAEPIILPSGGGMTATLEYTVESNVEDYEIVVTSEGDFFSLSDNTITTISENRTGESRKGCIVLAEKSGLCQPVRVAVTQPSYHFHVSCESVTLEGKEGSEAALDMEVMTDIPDYELVFSQEGDFFSFSEGVVIALQENRTGVALNGCLWVTEAGGGFEAVRIGIIQESLAPLPPEECVAFEDLNFKNVMVARADTNGDGEVSYSEAEAVEEIVAVGKGIKNLAGLECFQNVWKLDLRDNDIKDATILKELHLLYWLDLKGNQNLQTFDVSGCTQDFEHCEFEVTENLSYYLYRQQCGVSETSDPLCQHSHHIIDTRSTTDWSMNNRLHQVQRHSRVHPDANGKIPSIIFSGMGYLDVDMKDGSFRRQMLEGVRCLWKYSKLAEYKDYFDVYYMEHVLENRNLYYMQIDEWCALGEAWLTNPLKVAYWDEVMSLQKVGYESLYGASDDLIYGPSEQFPPQVFIRIDCIPEFNSGIGRIWSMYTEKAGSLYSYDYKKCMYPWSFIRRPEIGTDKFGKEDEIMYSYRWANTDFSIDSLFKFIFTDELHKTEVDNEFLEFWLR